MWLELQRDAALERRRIACKRKVRPAIRILVSGKDNLGREVDGNRIGLFHRGADWLSFLFGHPLLL